MFSLSRTSKRRREGIDPRLIEISDLAISITLVDFGHPEDAGLRTAARQQQLYKRRKSNCDGYLKQSKHQSGKALDFYAYVNGKASWEHEHLSMVACALLQAASMLGYKVSWGGLWQSDSMYKAGGVRYGWDMPHIEIID